MKFGEENATFYSLSRFKENISFVYFLTLNDEVVYVGQTYQGIFRPLAHRDKTFDGFYMVRCEKERLNTFEREMILKYQPRYNKTFGDDSGTISIKKISDWLMRNSTPIRTKFLEKAFKELDISVIQYEKRRSIAIEDFEKIKQYANQNRDDLRIAQLESKAQRLSQDNAIEIVIRDVMFYKTEMYIETIKDDIYLQNDTSKELLATINQIKSLYDPQYDINENIANILVALNIDMHL